MVKPLFLCHQILNEPSNLKQQFLLSKFYPELPTYVLLMSY